MPELPEIACRAREMNEALSGRVIHGVAVTQPKCLNVPVAAFERGLRGATLGRVTHHGKWLFLETSKGHLLLNLGMGGEILLVPSKRLPEKWRICFDLDHSQSLAVNFWWFGYAHYIAPGKLAEHAMSASLGPNALDVSLAEFRRLLDGRRGAVKSFLLDQSKLAGIGNAYIHDILFRAKLHPLEAISRLSPQDVRRLHGAIRTELQRSVDKGGAFYEVDLHGRPGGFLGTDLLVGYREGKLCPKCGTTIVKIKTGSTASFICPKCQRRTA
ncbi:MAG: Fpg/Nei family DNA glycosylase [Candidatus Bipolaricaulota bacterium]|nr:Fpg/Nei family DNA glycosylase [Candidatus Bipolaricaulota bacterium]